MRFLDEYKAEHYNRLSHRILLATAGVFVISTTLLNLAFTIAPVEMIRLVRDLMA